MNQSIPYEYELMASHLRRAAEYVDLQSWPNAVLALKQVLEAADTMPEEVRELCRPEFDAVHTMCRIIYSNLHPSLEGSAAIVGLYEYATEEDQNFQKGIAEMKQLNECVRMLPLLYIFEHAADTAFYIEELSCDYETQLHNFSACENELIQWNTRYPGISDSSLAHLYFAMSYMEAMNGHTETALKYADKSIDTNQHLAELLGTDAYETIYKNMEATKFRKKAIKKGLI